MTAIYGELRFDGEDPRPDVERLSSCLKKYGADSSRFVSDGAVCIGRNLKHLLDEDRFDTGPVDAAGSRYVVVADVRLTEREDLARQLDLRLADTLSDAALVAAAIEQWHEAAFDRIYGCFAIAAWDKVERRFLLARDHFGYRPLVFHRSDRRLVFASMAEGLRTLPDVPRGVNQDAMRYLLRFGGMPRRSTGFAEIDQVAPGHFAIASASGLHQTRYWYPDTSPLLLPRHEDYVASFRDHFEHAVETALRGAGSRVGAHLSSGFDSTAVVTTAARQLHAKGAGIIAYTAVPKPGAPVSDNTLLISDESHLAAATAAMHENVEHVLVCPERALLEPLKRDPTMFGEPALNLCNQTWMDEINELAEKRGLQILLVGYMGNASISEPGWIALAELFRKGKFGLLWTISRGWMHREDMQWHKIVWNTFSPLLSDRIWHGLRKIIGRKALPFSRYSPMRPEQWQAASIEEKGKTGAAHPLDLPWDQEWPRPSRAGLTERLAMMNVDYGCYLKGVLGAWGIDQRDPTGDRRLCEFSLRVPTEHLIWNGKSRALLRALLEDRAPAAVTETRTFGMQAADWGMRMSDEIDDIREEVSRIALFKPSADIIDVPRLGALLDRWHEIVENDALQTLEGVADYRTVALRAISVASFMRKATGSNH